MNEKIKSRLNYIGKRMVHTDFKIYIPLLLQDLVYDHNLRDDTYFLPNHLIGYRIRQPGGPISLLQTPTSGLISGFQVIQLFL